MRGTSRCELCQNQTPQVELAMIPALYNRELRRVGVEHRGLLCPSCKRIYGPESPTSDNYAALILLRVAATLERIEANLSAK